MKQSPLCPKPNIVFILLFTFFLILPNVVSAQEKVGRPAITNYNYQDYEAGPTNWWVIEGDNGIMYFANTSGVLEFDGVNWNVITLPNNVAARSFKKDKNGVIYVGAEGDLGYLAPDKLGKLTYISLVDKIPEEHRIFSEVWEVDYYKDAIVYRTSNKLFIWNGDQMKVIVSDDAFHVGKVINGEYIVRIWGRGLCKMVGDKFEVVPNGEKFTQERIYVILAYDEKNLLIGSRTQGFYLYDGKDFQPFKTEIDDDVKGKLYLPGVALPDGRFIINTISDGSYLISHDGKLIQEYSTTNGLQDGSTDYVYVDSRGILWLALFNGISRADLNSDFSYIDSNMGLETNVVWDTSKFKDVIYFTTNNGIYYLDSAKNEIIRIPGTSGQGGEFFQHKGKLYAGSGDMGMIEIKDKSFTYIKQSINYDFRARFFSISQLDSNRVFAFFDAGVASFYYDEKKAKLEFESEIIKPFGGSGFQELKNGDILIGSVDKGEVIIMKPKLEGSRMDLQNSDLRKFTEEDGLPHEYIGINKFFGQILFSDITGKTYLLDEDSGKIIEHTFPFNDLIDPKSNLGIRSRLDDKGRLWANYGTGLVIVEKSGDSSYQFNTETFKELRNRALFNVYTEPSTADGLQTVWLSGSDGVVRYQGNLDKPPLTDFNTQIRGIRIAGDSLLYGGSGRVPQDFNLDFKRNTIVFSYAAPLYKGQKNIEYSTYLEGLDKNWSEWNKQTSREYINLPSGSYTFKAKAKNLFGNITPETAVSFNISTPWYRTWLAYVLYAIGFLALVFAIVRRRTKLLRARQKELEENVEARTQEVQKRLEELATINHVSNALTEKLEPNELIKLVGDEMKRLFHSDITYLAILDHDTNIINFPYQDGDSMQPMNYGEGLTSKIIRTGEPLLINRDKDIASEYDKMGIKNVGKGAISYLGVPIKSEGEVIGVLSVQSTQQESRFTEEDKRLLGTIATNVGVAIHNAELFEEAKVAKARAEDANEAKSAFLSTVSHELRTPLTSVLGFAKIIRKRLEEKIFPAVQVEDQKMKRTMKQVSENLNVVVSEGERLTTLINDVLDLAKIESGKMEWNKRPIFLQDAINRAISSTQSLIDAKNLKLEKKISSDLPPVHADEDKLIQVVINLLSNAIKFTDKGKIRVEAYKENGQIIVEIQDTGIGISENDKSKVFEKFRQAGDTLTDKPKGTGLGLPICREIIEHHGGIIWMTSEPGVGSTFFFSIPSLKEGTEQQPIHLDRILKSLKKQIKHSSENAASNKKPTILVVDDDTPIRSLLRQELGDAGYNIKEAANGKAALDMVRHSKPDLIILDVMMPEINGFDVAAVLKNDPTTMDIPIIILSIVQDIERGMRIGVDRYLTKPINTEQLFHEVDVLLEQGVSNKKVLVVDSDSSAVKSLSDVLSARGYKVLETEPSKVYEMATESQPDIIMLNSVYNGDPDFIKNLKLQKGMENVMFFIYQ
ncbi:Y_Y_Y domain-containing protein [Flavobacteriaceae bacterium MAR_2010_188]|nr:Y_Y_Y domain-containing protein [Flavobacteriaceae bacterium MAR_2010_188]